MPKRAKLYINSTIVVGLPCWAGCLLFERSSGTRRGISATSRCVHRLNFEDQAAQDPRHDVQSISLFYVLIGWRGLTSAKPSTHVGVRRAP